MTTLRRCGTADEVADSAASALLAPLKRAYEEGRAAHVVLLGGSVAEPFCRALASLLAPHPELLAITHWWWGDERFVARDSPLRNALVFQTWLARPLAIRSAMIHELPAADSGLSLDEAAQAAEFELSDVAEFDVVVLGMGPDGHVASLFPGFAIAADRSVQAVRDAPKPPPERLTLTPARLNRTRSLWLLVTGEGKSEALRRLLTHTAADEPTIPAQLLDTDRLTVFAERSVWSPLEG